MLDHRAGRLHCRQLCARSAHCLPTVCPADPVHRCRFAVKWASTSACMLPILGKLLVGHQPALDRALLPGDAAASARGGRRRRPRS
eukprot:5454113-Prymnesium_polylepis.1